MHCVLITFYCWLYQIVLTATSIYSSKRIYFVWLNISKRHPKRHTNRPKFFLSFILYFQFPRSILRLLERANNLARPPLFNLPTSIRLTKLHQKGHTHLTPWWLWVSLSSEEFIWKTNCVLSFLYINDSDKWNLIEARGTRLKTDSLGFMAPTAPWNPNAFIYMRWYDIPRLSYSN